MNDINYVSVCGIYCGDCNFLKKDYSLEDLNMFFDVGYENGEISSLEEVKGEDCGEMLRTMNYQDEEIISGYENQLKRAFDNKKITLDDYCQILKKMKSFFHEYPYLLPKNSLEIIE